MEKSIEKKITKFGLIPKGGRNLSRGKFLRNGRFLIGRADSCDFIIENEIISAVHAVLEIRNSKVMIYDMNSTNATFVNGQKIVAKELKVGDLIKFANIEYELVPYSEAKLPPVLDILADDEGPSTHDAPPVPAEATAKSKKFDVVHPLSIDKKADSTEYIFEDVESLYPIFRYNLNKESVEVTIIYDDEVFSIDYLPIEKRDYFLVGKNPGLYNVELPYLGESEKKDFISIGEEVNIHLLEGFSSTSIGNKDIVGRDLILHAQDILRMDCGKLSLFIRRVPAPPKVATAPFFRRDKEFKRYLFMVLLLVATPLFLLSRFDVDEEKQKDKAPDRIATILYRKKMIPKKKKKESNPPEKKKLSLDTPKKEKVEKVVKKEVPKEPSVSKAGVKKKTKKSPVKKVKKVGQSKNVNKKTKKVAPPRKKVTPKKVVAPRKVKRKTKGHVDTFKSANFKSTVSSIISKSSLMKGSVKADDINEKSFKGVDSGSTDSDSLKTAKTAGEVGSLSGLAKGSINYEKGTEGLSVKKGVLTAGIPSQTVVLGSMDPNIIRQILREYIPQFRHCYQRELERKSDKIEGVLQLVFTIGSSGHVSKAGVDDASSLPANVSRCAINVLKGITFPAPKGGGVVDVKQPINYYPKRI